LSGLYRPRTLPEALSLLAEDPDAKAISGGATLVAMMNARVIEPDALVSLSAIEELRGISEQADGTIRIEPCHAAEPLPLVVVAHGEDQRSIRRVERVVRRDGRMPVSEASWRSPRREHDPRLVGEHRRH
jgi:hypothetical protein